MPSLLIEKRRLTPADLPRVIRKRTAPVSHNNSPYTGTPKHILKKVCNYYGVYQSDLTSKSRKAGLVRARLVFSYVCRELGFPLASIGAAVNRDHSNVYYQHKKLRERIDISKPWFDEMLCQEVNDVSTLVNKL